MDGFDVLIVGAGHAGAQLALMLRQLKFDGSIGLLGAESEPPYERPPLSKDYLTGEKPFERILIRPATFWPDRDVKLLPGHRVSAVNATAHNVTLSNGSTIGYRTLVWAAGGTPRRLSCLGSDCPDIHAIRTRADTDGILAGLDRAQKIVIIGGGYIGLEAAAALRKRDKRIAVIEAQDRVLARVAGEPLSRFYEAEHRSHSVDIRLSTNVDSFELGNDGRLTGVRLGDGDLLAADMAIVGIGIIPETGPLIVAGAAGGDGVDVDPHCRTSLPDIFAIGDCAAHANRFAGGAHIRIESVQNANDQANVTARAIMGELVAYDMVPWFWSNQYDLRLQTVGLSIGHDMTVLRGEPAQRSFSLIYLKGGRVVALDCVNATKDYVQGRALVMSGAAIAPERLADISVPLKELAAAS